MSLLGLVILVVAGRSAAWHFLGTGTNQPASALRWLGVDDPRTPPWDRPAQAAVGLVLGCVAVRRGRWPAVVLLGANARIALDPSVYTYCTASVLQGTLLWDVIGQRRLVPWWSWIGLITLWASSGSPPRTYCSGRYETADGVASREGVCLAGERLSRPCRSRPEPG